MKVWTVILTLATLLGCGANEPSASVAGADECDAQASQDACEEIGCYWAADILTATLPADGSDPCEPAGRTSVCHVAVPNQNNAPNTYYREADDGQLEAIVLDFSNNFDGWTQCSNENASSPACACSNDALPGTVSE